MTTTRSDPNTALPGRPPIVDPATWQAARDELLVREGRHRRTWPVSDGGTHLHGRRR